jgi:hypothetical protein
VLGGAPKAVEQAQNIFVCVFSWAWTSSPITGSNSIDDALIRKMYSELKLELIES